MVWFEQNDKSGRICTCISIHFDDSTSRYNDMIGMVMLHIHWQHYIFRCRKWVINSRLWKDCYIRQQSSYTQAINCAPGTSRTVSLWMSNRKTDCFMMLSQHWLTFRTLCQFTLCQLGKLPEEAEATAKFLEFLDQSLNAFSSNSIHSKQKFGHAMSSTSGHIEFLSSAMDFLNDLTLSKETSNYCVTGWKISIRALLCWWLDLHIRSTKH